ncbi:MAG: rnhA operon protein [Halobacteriaceae archaeon]
MGEEDATDGTDSAPADDGASAAGRPNDAEPGAGAPAPPVALEGTPLTSGVVSEVVRLTRHARDASTIEEAAAARERRREVLADYGYRARVRSDNDTLVCYPAEWLTDGTVDVDAVEDVDRAVEVPLTGAGDADRYVDAAARNEAVADRVASAHGPVHGANAAVFATFMSNHYARSVGTAGRREVAVFREDYFPRNAWPTDEQERALPESLALVFEAAGRDPPPWLDDGES